MTLSTLFLVLSGKRLSFTGHSAIQESFTPFQDRPPGNILRDLIFFTLVLEGLGAVLLFTGFMNSAPLPRALYLSVFHSVSAFCNAGFSLFPDSFISYKSSVVINLTICALIIFSGIGFPVLSELKDRFLSRKKKRSPMSLHAKLVLSITGVMLVAGTLVFLTMESRITLQKLPWLEKVVASLFLSVNARTAGFNSLTLGNMANETLLFMILLMFVGASPGSCGGGIKTTCLATLVALGRSRLKGEKRPNLFGRSLSDRSVGRAVVADATQGKVLQSLGVAKVDAAVVCIGSVMEASALACLNLKDLGVDRIIAKAISEIHSRLLYKVGASEVIFPEKDQALSLAERLHNPNILEYMRFVEGYSIIEFAPPNSFMGKKLKHLNLINDYGIQAIAIKELVPERLTMIPTGDFIIKQSDVLILLGPNTALDKLQKIKK
jgi:Trk K+ transport system NAD-binding subunit